MKMARASEADIDASLAVNRILDDLLKGYMPAVDEGEEDDGTTWFDRDDADQCKAVLGKLLDAADKGSLFRVAFGMQVVLDPRNELLDPNADTLEKHPKVIALEKDAGRYRWLRDDTIVTPDDQRCINVVMGRLPFRDDQKDEDLFGNELDEAIDAAMSASKEGA